MSNAMALSRRALDRVWRSRFVRNVAVVASGTAGAQAISIAFAPLITRIYGPEAFGLLGTFMAIVAFAIPVAALAYPIAIVLPREDRDALGLVRLSAILSFGVALLAAALVSFGGDWLVATLGAESVAGYLFLIPVAMLFAAWMQIAQQWLIRKKQFGAVARSAVSHSLLLNSAYISIGWLHPVGAALIALATLGHALHAALLYIGARRRYQAEAPEVEGGPCTPLMEIAHQYRDFPRYRAPQDFINAASQSLPILILAAFFGPVAAGFYTLAKMVMAAPTNLLRKAVGDVFYSRISETANAGQPLVGLVAKTTLSLSVFGLLPFGVIFLFGPEIFSFVFGFEWVAAGEYARWLSLWLYTMLVTSALANTLPVIGAQEFDLAFTIYKVALRLLVLAAFSWWFANDVVVIASFSVVSAILNLQFMLLAFRRIKHHDCRPS